MIFYDQGVISVCLQNTRKPTKYKSIAFVRLKGLCQGQKCLYLFSDYETYHEQMSPIPSSHGTLDIALSNAHT